MSSSRSWTTIISSTNPCSASKSIIPTITTAVKRQTTPTIPQIPPVAAPTISMPTTTTTTSPGVIAGIAVPSALVPLMAIFMLCVHCRKRKRERRAPQEQEAESGSTADDSPADAPANGSLEVMVEGDDGRVMRQVSSHPASLHSHTSRTRRASHSQAPRGARHSGATGTAVGISSMSSSGGGSGGGGGESSGH